MPDGGNGPSYRNELAAAYERLARLEARNRELEQARDAPGAMGAVVPDDRLRDLAATLARWNRVRATLATLLGLSGLFALHIAEQWSVRAALLAACASMVAVGITLAWPHAVLARVDPKPYALDVSRRWRRTRRRVRHEDSLVRIEPSGTHAIGVRVADEALAPANDAEHDATVCASAVPASRSRHTG